MREALRLSKLFVVDELLDPQLEVTTYISDFVSRHDIDPSFLFTRVKGARIPLIMNLLKREVLLASLGVVDEPSPVSVLASRLEGTATVTEARSEASLSFRSLAELPLLQHQPRDVGKYLTSFVGALVNPADGTTNLGFYRGLVAGERDIVLFMDPRTDAHKIVVASLENADRVPISLYNGGPVSTYLAAAAKLPAALDSYQASARLAGRPLVLASGEFPAAPAEAEVVLQGFVTRELREEGPFGEFKGYYCTPTRSPLVKLETIAVRPDAAMLGLFCGKETGLTLMALQNEILLLDHLRRMGFDVSNVTYPLAAFGEYAAIIESNTPTREMVQAGLDFDKRSKLVAATRPGIDLIKEAAVFPVMAEALPYFRYGRVEGFRLGIVCDTTHPYEWVEL